MYLNSDETGQWQETVIDSEIYFDPNGPVYFFAPQDPVLSVTGSAVKIAYYHSAYEHIRVSSRSGCGYTSVIASDPPFRIGDEFRYNFEGRSFAAIRSLPNGLAKMTYYDQANGRLMAAQSSPGLSLCANNSPFANVAVGQSAESDFVVSNDSGRSANVAPVANFISSPFSIVGDGCSGRVLTPGSTCSLRLRFTPTSSQSDIVPFAVEYVLDSGYDQVIFATVEANAVSAGSSPPSGPAAVESNSRCFIATAAFGSPLAVEVQYLREFRDRYLMTSSLGRAFVDLYYRYSPPVADFLRDHDLFRSVVRFLLVPVVELIKPLVKGDSPGRQFSPANPEDANVPYGIQAMVVHGPRRSKFLKSSNRTRGLGRARRSRRSHF